MCARHLAFLVERGQGHRSSWCHHPSRRRACNLCVSSGTLLTEWKRAFHPGRFCVVSKVEGTEMQTFSPSRADSQLREMHYRRIRHNSRRYPCSTLVDGAVATPSNRRVRSRFAWVAPPFREGSLPAQCCLPSCTCMHWRLGAAQTKRDGQAPPTSEERI